MEFHLKKLFLGIFCYNYKKTEKKHSEKKRRRRNNSDSEPHSPVTERFFNTQIDLFILLEGIIPLIFWKFVAKIMQHDDWTGIIRHLASKNHQNHHRKSCTC